jgi:diaphanous 1
MKHFTTSVQHITGQELEVKAASATGSTDLVEQEMEALRTKVEELSDEVNSFSFRGASFTYHALAN